MFVITAPGTAAPHQRFLGVQRGENRNLVGWCIYKWDEKNLIIKYILFSL